MSEISSSSRLRSNDVDFLPRRQQWALIYQQKAKQYEQLKQLQKETDRQKKNLFKQQLDSQIIGKNDVHKLQRQQDRRYYELITRKAEQMKQKEQRDKQEKIVKRRFIEEQNRHLLENNHQRNQRSVSANPRTMNYSFDIGYKSENDRKMQQEAGKRNMIDSLDQQMHMKEQQKRQQRLNNMNLQQINNKYQDEYHRNRNRGAKNYAQNPNVYHYYQNLTMEKVKRQRQIQHRLVDDAALRKAQEEYRRMQRESQKKSYLTHQMKQTLDQQVKIHNYRKAEEMRVNPQQHSYSIIGTMFKQKVSPYDKRQYSEYLRRQAQQQKRRKQVYNHMSEQQYKLNLNQLNKAVSGNYAHENYQDRSLTAIGEKQAKMNHRIADTVLDGDSDTDIVKQRVESIKNRKRGAYTQENPSTIF